MIKAVIFDMYETLITLYNCPVYFGTQIAMDAGIPEKDFQALWRPTESDRSTGKLTLEEALRIALKGNGCYSEELLDTLVQKRTVSKRESFDHLHPQILPMLEALKGSGVKIGLISNCFSEEVPAIRNSVLYPYFDGAFLSYEQGIQKPDAEIYRRCMDHFRVKAKECLYIGDGGSHELEAAAALGMHTAQAVWYLREGTLQPAKRKPEFRQIENPLDVLKYIYKAMQ